MLVVVDFEQLSEARLTDVKTDKYDLLVKECEAHSKVGCNESLAFARCA